MNQTVFPEFLKVFVSFACNLKCRHCVDSHVAGTVAPMDDGVFLRRFEAFLADAAAQNPDLKVYLSGGEPLLSSRFFETAAIMKNAGMPYKTITNGILLFDKLYALLSAPPKSLWITFNGTEERHDKTVGCKGGFQQLCSSVKRALPILKDAGIRVGAVLMINDLTYAHLTEELEVLSQFAFDEVVVQHLSFISNSQLECHNQYYMKRFGKASGFCFGEGADGFGIDPLILHQQLCAIDAHQYPFPVIVFPPMTSLTDLNDYYSPEPLQWKNRKCSRADRELWIFPDGKVKVCFAHDVGDITQTAGQIHASSAWKDWKQTFDSLSQPLPGCVRCHRLYM